MTSLSTTGTDVFAALAVTGGALPTDPVTQLAVINAAIRDSWPSIRITEKSLAAATLVASTEVYSLSALSPAPHRDVGVALVTIQDSTDMEGINLSHHAGQYFDASADTWYLRLPLSIAAAYASRAIDITYQYPHPDVADLDEAIYLPQAVLAGFVECWACKYMLNIQNRANTQFGSLYDRVYNEYRRALDRNSTRATNLPSLRTVYPPRLR
jgi:hypothetical protein